MNRDTFPHHMNRYQFVQAQRVAAFGNHVRHLIDTGNHDELARLGGIFDNGETRNFLFDAAFRESTPGPPRVIKGLNGKDIPVVNTESPAYTMWQAHRIDPDTAHISLNDSGVEYFNEPPKEETRVEKYDREKRLSDRMARVKAVQKKLKESN